VVHRLVLGEVMQAAEGIILETATVGIVAEAQLVQQDISIQEGDFILVIYG
jgi:hypothetical protein